MAIHAPGIDAYISSSADFAQPILEYLRAVVHAACPEVVEGLKWGMPFFSYRDAPICVMAAFKQHCSFRFWLANAVLDKTINDGMSPFGKLNSLKDLPHKKTDYRLRKEGHGFA